MRISVWKLRKATCRQTGDIKIKISILVISGEVEMESAIDRGKKEEPLGRRGISGTLGQDIGKFKLLHRIMAREGIRTVSHYRTEVFINY